MRSACCRPCAAGVVHDGLWSYWHYEQCDHALCNAHHLRELTFVEEQLKQPWAGQLKTLLLEIKEAADRARAELACPRCQRRPNRPGPSATPTSWPRACA